MRSSFTIALLLTFVLGASIERLVLDDAHQGTGVDVYMVVLAAVAFLSLLYVLYQRYVNLHLMLARNHLDYLNVNVDGVSLCESLAKRCEVLRHQRNDLSDDLIGAQVQLQEVTELSRLLLDKLPQASILVNQHGSILGVSQRAQLLTGYPVNEVYGMSIGKLKLFDDLTDLFNRGWSQQLATRSQEVAVPQMGHLKGKAGRRIDCTWNITELSLPVHRYYLITLIPYEEILKVS